MSIDKQPAYTPGPWSANIDDAYVTIDAESTCVTDCESIEQEDWSELHANARLIASAPCQVEQHITNLTDLDLLRQAIDAGDPKGELLVRVADIVRRTEAVVTSALGEDK